MHDDDTLNAMGLETLAAVIDGLLIDFGGDYAPDDIDARNREIEARAHREIARLNLIAAIKRMEGN